MCDCFDPFKRFCTTRETPLDRSERKQPSRQPTTTAELQPTVAWPFGAAAMAKKSKASKGSSGKKSSGDGGRLASGCFVVSPKGVQDITCLHVFCMLIF